MTAHTSPRTRVRIYTHIYKQEKSNTPQNYTSIYTHTETKHTLYSNYHDIL